ncbi:hypothetical protein LLB_0455 [Legionella longbeachae D-4968]|nr:hypothetical protein LLB_0455 [Legionella longbeachae D-4968]
MINHEQICNQLLLQSVLNKYIMWFFICIFARICSFKAKYAQLCQL